jgi:hypothetical protein
MNIGDLRKQAFNSSTDLLPLMQELLDYSGTIAVTLRKSDIESASSDLARYTSRYHDLQNLIIRLDMNESEIARFSQDAGQQKDMLSQFVTTSESLQSLEKLEIQYQDEGNPESVTKVRPGESTQKQNSDPAEPVCRYHRFIVITGEDPWSKY